MNSVSNVFVRCPQCKEEDVFEIIRVGAKPDSQLPTASSMDTLYASIRQAAYAQCELCGFELDGNELVDYLETALLEIEEGD